MKLRTELKIKNELQLNPFSGAVFMGSCFSDNIGGRVQDLGLPTLVNPFGVIFHPEPLLDILEKAAEGTLYSEADIYSSENQFHSLAHHGSFNSTSRDELLSKMNQAIDLLDDRLIESKLLCLTLGTAWGYKYEGKVAANCHKLPQKIFEKSLSSSNEISSRMEVVLKALQRRFSDLEIVLTVSPVRHVKDGIVENSRSKAHLLTAVHEVKEKLSNVCYFPAYELVMDDLRDYRFYNSDLIHPSDMAIDYVYEGFKKFAFHNEEAFMELEKFQRLSAHKVLSTDELKVEEHKATLQRKKEELIKKFPSLNLG